MPPESQAPDRLGKHYAFKLSSGVVGMVASLLSSALVPRALGPGDFGRFGYVTSVFDQIVRFLSSGVSAAFYTKFSQRPDDRGLVTFFGWVSAAVGFSAVAITGLLWWLDADRVWPDLETSVIGLGLAWGLMTFGGEACQKGIDALGLTVRGEVVAMLQRLVTVIALATLFYFGALQLYSYFGVHLATLLLAAAGHLVLSVKAGRSLLPESGLTKSDAAAYAREFYAYAGPLWGYAFVGLAVNLADRWMLQTFSGSVEQGYFSFSNRISSLSLVFTGAMTPLFTRELAVSSKTDDRAEMSRLFSRHVQRLLTVSCFIGCFVSVNAAALGRTLGGRAFDEASLAVSLMALYPIHQTYGQMSGAVYYSTGQTALYRNINVIRMLAGLGVAYLLMAPVDAGGANMGGAGLAIKMLVIQGLGVHVMLYYNSRYLDISFADLMLRQVTTIGLFLGLAWLCSSIVPRLFELEVVDLAVRCILYTAVSAALIYAYPALVSCYRRQLMSELASLFGRRR